MTDEHRITNPQELALVVSRGGVIQNHRLNGKLALSRSFGIPHWIPRVKGD